MSTGSLSDCKSRQFRVRLAPLLHEGRAMAFPGDDEGCVNLDELAGRALQLPLRARHGGPRVRYSLHVLGLTMFHLRRILGAMVLASASALAAAQGEVLAPPLSGATEWINSPPLTLQSLRGSVVLVDFWTYSCINCLRTLPYLRAWADKYRQAGLVVIGVHTPEFGFEKMPVNVRQATKDLGITWPVAVDSDYAVWRTYRNQAWPALYFVDAKGQLRHRQYGEGHYEELEQLVQALLKERGVGTVPGGLVAPGGEGVQAAAGSGPVLTPETYLGYGQAEGGIGVLVEDRPHPYALPTTLPFNRWALGGQWRVERERAVALGAGTRVVYRFRARDVHMVLGPADAGKPVKFRVLIDGKSPAADHGADTDAQGFGTVDRLKLYQLLRQTNPGKDRVFEIEFLEPGAQAYAFTFG